MIKFEDLEMGDNSERHNLINTDPYKWKRKEDYWVRDVIWEVLDPLLLALKMEEGIHESKTW